MKGKRKEWRKEDGKRKIRMEKRNKKGREGGMKERRKEGRK